MSTENLHHRLAITLVILAGREREYLNNSVFKAQVDTLCRLLPTMVNGIALEAEERQRALTARMQDLWSRALHTDPDMPVGPLLRDLGLSSDPPKD
jgi:hypothetical protein